MRRRRCRRPAAGHRPPHPAPLLQRSGRTSRRRAGDGQPRPRLRRPHVQRRRHDSRRRGSAQAEAGRLLHGGRQHAHASPAGRRRPTCSSPTARTSSRCSRTTTCAAISRTRSPTASRTKTKFRSGLSIHDISKPAEMREIAFLEMPGFGINRLWWTGGRYAYVSAHFDGFTDHILCIVDLQNITKPEIVSKWWLPGMHRAGGEPSDARAGQARRAASHDRRRRSRLRRVARRRLHDPRHQRSGPSRSCSRASTGRRRFPAARTRRCRCRAATSRSSPTRPTPRSARRACSTRSSWTCARRRTRCRSRRCRRRRDRDFCGLGTFGPHNLHENRPGSFQSEETFFATYNVAGVRVFDIRDAFAPKEIASWIAADAEEADRSAAERRARREVRRHLRHEGRPDLRQRLERGAQRAAIRGIATRSRVHGSTRSTGFTGFTGSDRYGSRGGWHDASLALSRFSW